MPASTPRTHQPELGVHFVEAAGLRFGYLEWGEGPLVLLLHGFPDSARTWDVIGPGLGGAGYHVVAPYLRGYAPSGLPERDTDTQTLGMDVVGLVQALGGGKPARVVGHDWGAEAVYAAIALAPQAFERAVTVAIPHRATVPRNPLLLWTLRHFFTLSAPGAEARFAAHDFAMIEMLWRRWSPTWHPTGAELDQVKNVFAAPGVVHAALGYYRAARLRTPELLQRPVTVPTLTIAGADDPGVAPSVFENARPHFVKGYEVVTVPGGHFCHRESPDQVISALKAFFSAAR